MAETATRLRRVDHTWASSGVRACINVDLDVEPGKIHALVGENGAGKTTLGHILTGVVKPDAGLLTVPAGDIDLSDRKGGLIDGMGLVRQRSIWPPALEVWEAAVLGRRGVSRRRRRVLERFRRTAGEWGLGDLDPRSGIARMDAAALQRAELTAALMTDPDILVLDEPASAWEEGRSAEFDGLMMRLRKEEKSVVLITHRIDDVFRYADAVTVMRRGRVRGTWPVGEIDRNRLTTEMFGEGYGDDAGNGGPEAAAGTPTAGGGHLRTGSSPASGDHLAPGGAASPESSPSAPGNSPVPGGLSAPDGPSADEGSRDADAAENVPTLENVPALENVPTLENVPAPGPLAYPGDTPAAPSGSRIDKAAPAGGDASAPPLELRDVSVRIAGRTVLDRISLVLHPGEILAVTGLREEGLAALEDLVSGNRRPASGNMRLDGEPAPADPAGLRRRGLRYVPADSIGRGASLSSTMAENMVILETRRLARKGILHPRRVRQWAETRRDHGGIAGQPDQTLAELSGGNIRKVILQRELHGNPRLLIVSDPTRGLDERSLRTVHDRLRRIAGSGSSVLLLVSDLDEAMALGDRMAVVSGGRLSDIRCPGNWDRSEAARLIAGISGEGAAS